MGDLPPRSGRLSRWAMVAGTRAASVMGSRGTKKTPSGYRCRAPGADLQRQPGLARAARPGQGEQPAGRRQCQGLGELLVTSHEAREAGRQVARRRPRRAECREIGRQAIDTQLPQVLWAIEVAQPMLAQVLPRHPLGEARADQGAGRARDEDLAAVRQARDARCAVDVQAHEAATDGLRFARVEAHPDLDGPVGRPRFGGQGQLRGDRRRAPRSGRCRRSRRRSRPRCPAPGRRAARTPRAGSPDDARGAGRTRRCRPAPRGGSSPRCR